MAQESASANKPEDFPSVAVRRSPSEAANDSCAVTKAKEKQKQQEPRRKLEGEKEERSEASEMNACTQIRRTEVRTAVPRRYAVGPLATHCIIKGKQQRNPAERN